MQQQSCVSGSKRGSSVLIVLEISRATVRRFAHILQAFHENNLPSVPRHQTILDTICFLHLPYPPPKMLEWYNWEVERAVSAFMLGDITPPRSFLMGNTNASTNGASGGIMDPPDFGGLGGGASAGAGSGGQGMMDSGGSGGRGGGAGAAGSAPGALSVIVGLPFRLLGKVGAAQRRDNCCVRLAHDPTRALHAQQTRGSHTR